VTKVSRMKATWSLFLVVWLSSGMLTSAQKDVCPPWFTPDNKSSTGCSCNEGARGGHEFKCHSNSISLQFGYCMTYNNLNGLSEFGKCPYITHYITDKFHFIQLPDNVSKLNEFMCGPLNREGTLCGKCKDGYGIALYSYTLECTKCWRHGYGWVLYYFLQLFPITVLYFLVVIFHIRTTSSPLSALVFMSQVMVYTIRLNVLAVRMYIENEVTGFSYVALQVMLVLCSIWSLDFFSICHSTILCKQQHYDYSCTCTGISCGILSHLSHFCYICMYKTPRQQLQTCCLVTETISQSFCSIQEKVGHQSIHSQCIYNIFASFFFQNSVCIFHSVVLF